MDGLPSHKFCILPLSDSAQRGCDLVICEEYTHVHGIHIKLKYQYTFEDLLVKTCQTQLNTTHSLN
jgi:hypothetical protein